MSVQHVYEITVIGGGPVGMFAAFMPGYVKRMSYY
ncbi:hypothetical protein AAULR_06038 [Lacticaseibacillus rhamnosus MTCC 5462]|nr:hypothetical protein AAULR_06038 [Lacticaseibacillus rhamnosus MTCC 5462]